MPIRQEKLVFAVVVVVLGAMTWGLLAPDGTRRRTSRGGEEAELVHQRVPDASLALPNERVPALERSLFAPPRDTRPLPPLELVEPPLTPLAVLLPPTDPGPAPRLYGKFLRRPLVIVSEPGLFLDGEDEAGDEAAASSSDVIPAEDLTAAELAPQGLAELAAEARRRYDWVRRGPGDVVYGRIANPDRFGLLVDHTRDAEPIALVEVDPETGKEKLASVGAPALQIGRERVVEFGFAETATNHIEAERRALRTVATRAEFERALALVDYALEHRHEADGALAAAEELARRALEYDAGSVDARLALGRVLEAGFRFEQALATYAELREAAPSRPEPLTRRGLLEEQLLLFGEAERDLRAAVKLERSNFDARLALGQFLARRGRPEEALEHLRAGLAVAPSDPSSLARRVAVRVALADALVATGALGEAAGLYAQAVSAGVGGSGGAALAALVDRARAGQQVCALLDPAAASGAGPEDRDQEGGGFELSLAGGTAALLRGDYAAARTLYEAAARQDPLRAVRPLSALAYLALVTSNGAAATDAIGQALEAAPHDPYALYLRGVLSGLEDDYEAARASLMEALDEEVGFVDAVASAGRFAFRAGEFEDARRFLERAHELEPERGDVQALLGLDLLRLGAVQDAAVAFDETLQRTPSDPIAKAGKAWCAYLGGDVTEGLVLLRDLDDARRAEGEEDPWRVWARAQIDRIQDHVEKVEWRDAFHRSRLINGWQTRESDGPVVSMQDGAVKIEGVFDRPEGVAEVFREYPSSDFVSFTARLKVSADTVSRTGIRIARERTRRSEREVIGEASVSRFEDGALQVRIQRKGRPEELTDMAQSFPVDTWVTLSIERSGEASDSTVTLSLDGVPLVEDVSVPSLGAANAPLVVGLFVEGDAGRKVSVLMDDASVVYRGNR